MTSTPQLLSTPTVEAVNNLENGQQARYVLPRWFAYTIDVRLADTDTAGIGKDVEIAQMTDGATVVGTVDPIDSGIESTTVWLPVRLKTWVADPSTITARALKRAKRLGFSDGQLAHLSLHRVLTILILPPFGILAGLADGGLRAGALCRGERAVAQRCEHGAEGAGLLRHPVGPLHLAQDLGFAEHQ